MNKKITYGLILTVIILFIFNIVTLKKLNEVKEVINTSNVSIGNRIDGLERQLNSNSALVTASIKNLLNQNESVVREKSYSMLSYDKELKNADIKVLVTLKEVDKNSKIYLKEEKQGVIEKFLMESEDGLEYSVNRSYKLGDEVKLSVLILGDTTKGEFLFEINLKKILEERITKASGGSSTSTSPNKDKVNYYMDFEIENKYDGDEALRFAYVTATLEGNGVMLFNKDFSREGYNDELNRFIDKGNGVEGIKVNLNNSDSNFGSNGFVFSEDTKLKLTVKAIDNLGLTYEYTESFLITKTGQRMNETVNKDDYRFKLK
jgi:hypothetical protein